MTPAARTLLRRAAAAAFAVAILAGTFLAGRGSVGAVDAARGADPTGGDGQPTVWTVREETVGRSLTFTGQLAVSSRDGPVARWPGEGVVTAVHVDGPRLVAAGTPLYSVNLRPVVAAEGSLPAFRPLGPGERGDDVVQLRRFLCAEGWRAACGDSPRFDWRLAEAVRGWQRELGVPDDGVVGVGDILWFPSLPARLRPAATLAVGEAAPHGTRPYTVDDLYPVLRVPLTRDQAALVPPEAPAVVAGGFEAVVTAVAPADPGEEQAEFLLTLAAGADREPFCRAYEVCAELLGDQESTTVEVVVHTVPERTGPVVPAAAVETDPTGRTLVRLVDGDLREVTVLTAAGGMVVVDGLRPGEEIVIP